MEGAERCIDEEIPFEIPESWVWCRLRTLCEVIADCPHTTPKYYAEDTGYYSIDTTCIDRHGRIIGLRYTDRPAYTERTTRLVPQENDIVLTREGSLGRAALLPSVNNLCLGQRVMLLRLWDCLDRRLYAYVMLSPFFLSTMASKARGVGVKHINLLDVGNALVPVPPVEEQRRIAAALENCLAVLGKV